MNNRRGMLTSVITIGAVGTAIYGITRGIQNGTFQRLPQTISNVLNNQQVQQFIKPVQNMVGNQNVQETSNLFEGGPDISQQNSNQYN